MHFEQTIHSAFKFATNSDSIGDEVGVLEDVPGLLSSDSDASTSAPASNLSSIEITDSDEGPDVSLAAQ